MSEKDHNPLSLEIAAKAIRKLKARRNSNGVWFGLGMMGIVGWTVVVPTLLGTMMGVWLDHRYPGTISWTLTLLFIGLVVGCLNAWHWINRQGKEMREDEADDG